MSDISSPGCVVFLLDESAAMSASMKERTTQGLPSTKTNAQRVATALNALLNQLSKGPASDVALIGYKTNAQGESIVGSRWGGSLAGRDFVTSSELASAPLRLESRTRKVPAADCFSPPREEPVNFPVWYEPQPDGKASQVAAFNYARELLSRWASTAPAGSDAPLVLHISASNSGDGSPLMAAKKLLGLATPGGQPIVLYLHLAASADAPTSAFPANPTFLTMGSARDLFHLASPLPARLAAALRTAKVVANPGARGLIYNAKLVDVGRAFGLVQAYVKEWPSKPDTSAAQASVPSLATPPAAGAASHVPTPQPPALEQPASEQMASEQAAPEPPVAEAPSAPSQSRVQGIVLLLDRSVADPYASDPKNAAARLQEHANALLKQIGKLKQGKVEVAIVSYGAGPGGELDLRTTYEGPLAGQTFVPQTALETGALRVEEHEEMTARFGALVPTTVEKPIFFDLTPTLGTSAGPAFAAVADMLTTWRASHPSVACNPIVLHLTRGQFDESALADMDQQWQSLTSTGPAQLYKLVVTELPHTAVAYPSNPDQIGDPALQRLWQIASPLTDVKAPPAVEGGARGVVINGKFDRLISEIKAALA